jgi:hypothetical protein
MRAKMSRPNWSVPKMCAALGEAKIAFEFCATMSVS